MNERKQKVEALFEEALALSAPEPRAGHLDRACGNDADLRREVEELLRAAEQAGGFLAVKPGETAATSDLPPPSLQGGSASVEQPGTIIGRYKLLEKIGEGGCGVVFMAEQEEPVRRKVALKIIKPGMDSRQVIARFEAERQALAMMDHPHIARVFDGGVTGGGPRLSPAAARSSPDARENSDGSPLPHETAAAEDSRDPAASDPQLAAGRPYFVMELVRGIRITDYCDQVKLPMAQRLELFRQVCSAVQHAHQKGIIHRDLKPSNILVTLHDGVPMPKVIDFGIAKATEGRLTDKTVYTELHQFIGTPAYMSPEQAEMSALDIDTRSDIYSLGVLLYELLTGTTPFDAQELLKAGFDEMRRVIRETEPPTPSKRAESLSESRAQRSGQHASAARRTLNPQLKAFSTDLDWIVMKALEKDRRRRYETANGLAADIQRHLNNEPVIARPQSATYRFQKMVRRNKVAFAAGTAVAAALIIGLTLSLWLFLKEREARAHAVAQRFRAEVAENLAAKEGRKAVEEAAIATAVNDFLRNDLLRAAGSDYQADVFQRSANPNLKVVEALDRAARNISDRFRDQPLVEAGIRLTIGATYVDLNDDLAAIPHLERALELRRRLGAEHEDTRACLRLLGVAYVGARRWTESMALFEELRRIETAKGGPDAPDALDALGLLGVSYVRNERIAEGIALLEENLKRTKARDGGDSLEKALAVNKLGLAYSAARQPDKAIELFQEALRLLKTKLALDHPRTLILTHNLATEYLASGRQAEAVPLLEEVYRLRKARLGVTNLETVEAAKALAPLYQAIGRDVEAEELFREMVEVTRTMGDRTQLRRNPSLRRLADFYFGKGRFAEAEPLYIEAIELARKDTEREPRLLEATLGDYGEFLYRQDRHREAETVYRELVTLKSARLAPGDEDRLTFVASLGRVLSDLAWIGRTNSVATQAELAHEAEKLLREVMKAREAITNLMRWRFADGASRLGGALVVVAATDSSLSADARLAKLTEAETLLLNANDTLQQSKSAESKYTRDSLLRVERLYQAWPNQEKAAVARQNLEAFDKARAERKAAKEAAP